MLPAWRKELFSEHAVLQWMFRDVSIPLPGAEHEYTNLAPCPVISVNLPARKYICQIVSFRTVKTVAAQADGADIPPNFSY